MAPLAPREGRIACFATVPALAALAIRGRSTLIDQMCDIKLAITPATSFVSTEETGSGEDSPHRKKARNS